MPRDIRLHRPMYTEYKIVGEMLNSNIWIYDLPKDVFLTTVMVKSHGALNPKRVEEIYDALMDEAGVNEPTILKLKGG